MASARVVTITIKGVVADFGTNRDETGVFGFAPGTSLADQPFTLVFTFDDSKAQTQITLQGNKPIGSRISGSDSSSPGVAVLTINGHSFSFGTAEGITSVSSTALCDLDPFSIPALNKVVYQLQEAYGTPYGSVVSVDLQTYASPFTPDYDWRSSFSLMLTATDSYLANFSINFPNGEIALVAEGNLVPKSITVAGTGLQIISPTDNATPQSQFVALTGTAGPGHIVTFLIDGVPSVYNSSADSDGYWEQVVKTGAGAHTVQAEDELAMSNVLHVIATPSLTAAPPLPNTLYSLLRTADIILTHGVNSPQVRLYGPNYTHAALFVGGDANGSPLIAEAVTAPEAGTLGQVRSVPIEASTVYTDGNEIDFFRPIVPLTTAARKAIAATAIQYTSLGLSYWSVTLDLAAPFSYAWIWWGNSLHAPNNIARFNTAKAYLLNKKQMTNSFICSTLVWRAYLDGTAGTVDISTPNNVRVTIGILASYLDPAFIQAIGPDFVFPDTIGLNTSVLFRIF